MTTLRFEGTELRFKNWIQDQGIDGNWSGKPNGCIMLRCGRQAQIHWSSTKGSLWVTGKSEAKSKLVRRLQMALPAEDYDFDDDDIDFDLEEDD